MLVTLEKFYARKGMGTTISFVKLWRHSHRSFLFCGNKLKLKQIMLPFQESVYRTSFDTHFTNLAGITKRSSKALNPPSMRTHFTAVSAASEEQYSNCGKVCNPYDAWENVSVMTREGKVQESNLFIFNFFIILRGCNCAKFALKYGSARPQKSLEQYVGLRKTANLSYTSVRIPS